MASLSSVPNEILIQIINETAQSALLNLRLVNKRLRELCKPRAFEAIWLVEHPESDIAVKERLRMLVDNDLLRHMRKLYLNPTSIQEDSEEGNMVNINVAIQGGEKVSIAPFRTRRPGDMGNPKGEFKFTKESNLTELAVFARKSPHASSRSPEYEMRLLRGVGDALRTFSMKSLKRFELRVDSPSYVRQLYGDTLFSPRETDESWFAAPSPLGAERETYFPNLETMVLHFTSLSPRTGFYPAVHIPTALNLLTTGCGKLKRLEVKFGEPDNYREWRRMKISPVILAFSGLGGADPASLTSLKFEGNVRMSDATGLVMSLKPMVNLREIYLGHITFCPQYEGSDGAAGPVEDWSHVFRVVKEMKHLQRFTFDTLANTTPLGPADYGMRSASAGSHLKNANKEGFSVITLFADELDALKELKGVVKKRRVKMGLGKKWEPIRMGG